MCEHTRLASVCCSSTCFMAVVKIYCKATEKPLRAELVLSSCLAFERNFSDKKEVSGPLGCVNIGLFSWSRQGAFQVISLLFKCPRILKLSVCNTGMLQWLKYFK